MLNSTMGSRAPLLESTRDLPNAQDLVDEDELAEEEAAATLASMNEEDDENSYDSKPLLSSDVDAEMVEATLFICE